MPVVAAAGEHDRLAPPATVGEIAGLVPGGRFVELEGAGHVSNRERPDVFNRLLYGFLAELGPRTGP